MFITSQLKSKINSIGGFMQESMRAALFRADSSVSASLVFESVKLVSDSSDTSWIFLVLLLFLIGNCGILSESDSSDSESENLLPFFVY